jgi:energy-coupling factor transporter ATP-binding protein EcfA2
MILRNFKYSEYDGTPEEWSINGLDLEKVNLLVGKNATGKSRTLDRIRILANMLTGKQLHPLDLVDATWFNAEFSDASNSYHYFLKTENREIIFEQLAISGKGESEVVLERKRNGEGEILYSGKKENIKFRLPDNQPAAFLKRDTIQHPFLEKLFEWADGVIYYSFGIENIQAYFLSPFNFDKIDLLINEGKSKELNNSIAIFYAGEKEFGECFKKDILYNMNKIDYCLTNIYLGQNPHSAIEQRADNSIIMLAVTEEDRNAILFQSQMSQGMFRALFILIKVEFFILKKMPVTILIDDIGEGLDFDRSTKLIKLLIELAEKNDNIQLIMSTNDRYVMNNVPFKYWQVIERKGGECKVYNYQNSKEKFDEFKYMGLNNFDFLATDYINSEWKKT